MVHAIAYATETRSFDPNRQLFLEKKQILACSVVLNSYTIIGFKIYTISECFLKNLCFSRIYLKKYVLSR